MAKKTQSDAASTDPASPDTITADINSTGQAAQPEEVQSEEVETPTVPSIDLTKIAVGTFAPMGNAVADYVRSSILDRAGVPRFVDSPGGKVIHPLRASLVHTHGGTQDKDAARLPEVFPPVDFAGPLKSAQDYLDLIDLVLSKP